MREMWEKKTTAHAVRPFDVLRANDWSRDHRTIEMSGSKGAEGGGFG